jgi:hypothetical protein
MSDFLSLVRRNRNCRNVWLGQVVSETGDHFNNIAVFSLVMETTGSALALSAVMLARAIPAVAAGPVAGVALDRLDRRRIMIASDLVRAAVALSFLFTIHQHRPWLVLGLSAALMFASPFFTAGRNSILPVIASPEEVHTANSLTQTTQWATQTVGTLLAGVSAAKLGYGWAFVLNAASFVVSAALVWTLRRNGGADFRPDRAGAHHQAAHPWRDYTEGLAYMRNSPLTLGIALLAAGWAVGGGATQILFTLFGQQVFARGAAGIGAVWSFAGLGLLAGGFLGHRVGRLVGFRGYKHAVSISYLAHGAAFVAFSLAGNWWAALGLVALSRVGMAVASVLNTSELLRYTPDGFRGRVFATLESARWSIMVLSMAAAGVGSAYLGPRAIGVVAGLFGTLTALGWAWANWRGHLPEPSEAHSKITGGQPA